MDKKIKTITVTQFDYIIRNFNDEELDIEGHPNHFSEYDREGNILQETKYNRFGEFEEMLRYGYDEKGNLINESYYPEDNELAEEKIFERNDSGQVVRALKKYQDGSVDTIAYAYDASNQLVKKITTTDEGDVEQVEEFTWDNGTLISHEILDEAGNLVSGPEASQPATNPTRITHNDKGQVIREEELDEQGEVYMTVNRTYDEDGHANEVEVFVDGRGLSLSRHYFLKYDYTFFE
jgi:hypothetical protein